MLNDAHRFVHQALESFGVAAAAAVAAAVAAVAAAAADIGQCE